MDNYLTILKRKALQNARNGKCTFFDESLIFEKLEAYCYGRKDTPVVLFMPSDEYWVLLTSTSIVYYLDKIIKEFTYDKISNRDIHYHGYKKYRYANKEYLCDHIRLIIKDFKSVIILPIEVLSVFSFSEPLSFIINKHNPLGEE